LRPGFGSFEADVVADAGHTAGRLLASGGLAYVAGQKFVSRHIDDGFGAVSVPGYANVRIYQENQLLARTNAAGIAVIPDLRAYEENHLRIETSDLPLDAKLGGETLTVVPRYRGAVLAEFPVTKTRTASVVIQLPDGTLLPPGLSLTIDGKPDAAFSGYGGVVFVTGVRSGLSLEAQWSQGHCRAVLERVPAEGVLPRLGPLICRPLEP
jgi:outer membrane usher protein